MLEKKEIQKNILEYYIDKHSEFFSLILCRIVEALVKKIGCLKYNMTECF